MGRNKIDRTGEINYNTFGSKMIITRYRKNNDIDVYFTEYDWTAKNVIYGNFKKGNIKCPYERSVYGVGYIGEEKYKISENSKQSKCYKVWSKMLQRCYDEKLHEKRPTYKGCKVCEEWLCFQNFAEWYYNNYYEIESERMCLDKDILNKGNKLYSPENCIFVPNNINMLFTKRDNKRGEYPIGVHYHKRNKKFQASFNIYDFKENKNKSVFLGYYENIEKAFEVYKEFKEKHIRKVADYYKDQIPSKLYDALYTYEVEITD